MLPNIPVLADVAAKGTFLGLVTISYDLVFQIINTLILFFVLKHFLFEPVKKVMDERQENINHELESAELKNKTADALIEEYEVKLKNIEEEGRTIIKEATEKGHLRASDIIKEADKEANNIRKRAHKDIEREQTKAVNELKEEIVTLSLLAASKVLEEDIDDNKHKILVNQFLDDLGDTKWEN